MGERLEAATSSASELVVALKAQIARDEAIIVGLRSMVAHMRAIASQQAATTALIRANQRRE